jgi:Ca-activated chloride channel family protein
MPSARIRSDASLILVPVRVTDAVGAPIIGLSRENFQVYEDNVEQSIAHFALEDAPISVGVLFDQSGSMRNKMRESAEAVSAFLHTTNPADEFFLVEFSEKPKLVVPFIEEPGEILREVARTRPFGRTTLLDAIHLAVVQMKNARNRRKALVIFSDGGDNRSRLSRGEVRDAILESDIQLYALGIFENCDPGKLTPEERGGPRLLSTLAEYSGGQLYTIHNLDDLAAAGARIGNDLRTQYLLGYFSNNSVRDGKYRHIKLKLTSPQPDLRASYRQGYYPPSE